MKSEKTVTVPCDIKPDTPTSSRRVMPVDEEIGERRLSPRDGRKDADEDYFKNSLDKFRRYYEKNGGLTPNREGYGKKK